MNEELVEKQLRLPEQVKKSEKKFMCLKKKGWKEKTWHIAGSYSERGKSLRNISYGALETFKILAKCQDLGTFLEIKYCKCLKDFWPDKEYSFF